MIGSIGNLGEKFLNWSEAFDTKGLKVNLKKTKVMVSGLKDKVLKSKLMPEGNGKFGYVPEMR